MTPDAISQLLAGSFDNPGVRTSWRGDHDLNPGMEVTPPTDLRPAAVLVPIVLRDAEPTLLFTQRTDHLEKHAGQVSFPGGHVENDDDGAEDTALRETEEEVGLHRRHIDIVGRLDQYLTRTGFSITPIVGIVKPPFKIRIDPVEVADVFEVPLDFLVDPTNHRRDRRQVKGMVREFYAMPYGDRYIWGATAGMVKNLADVLGAPEGEDTP